MTRIDKLNSALETKHLEAIVVLTDFNRRYLSGFTGTSGALVITKDKNLLIITWYISLIILGS